MGGRGFFGVFCFGGFLNRYIGRNPFSLIAMGIVICGSGIAMFAEAQTSRRVIRDLEVQSSQRVGEESATAKPAEVSAVSTDPVVAATGDVARQLGWMTNKDPVVPGATTAVATPTPDPNKTGDANVMQQIMSALAGKGGGGGGGGGAGAGTGGGAANNNSGAANNTGAATNSAGAQNTAGGTTNTAARDTASSNATRSDSVDPNRPLPADTQVEGRDCSATSKTWQPFTKHPFKINSCFGHRRSTRSHHNGIDATILHDPQTINPVAPGKIARAENRGGYGCEIVIEHDSCPAGVGGNKCFSQYAHLKKDRNGKCPGEGRVGQSVTACTELALMGNTGASQAPHLHFEVRTSLDSNSAKNPVTHFREWQAHKNYRHGSSTCGTVGNGQAPAQQRHNHNHGSGGRQ